MGLNPFPFAFARLGCDNTRVMPLPRAPIEDLAAVPVPYDVRDGFQSHPTKSLRQRRDSIRQLRYGRTLAPPHGAVRLSVGTPGS